MNTYVVTAGCKRCAGYSYTWTEKNWWGDKKHLHVHLKWPSTWFQLTLPFGTRVESVPCPKCGYKNLVERIVPDEID